MITFQNVTRENVNAVIRLKPASAQAHLVAPNAVSLSQAAYEPGAHVRGIYDGDAVVGLAVWLDPRGAPPWITPKGDPAALYLWRLMIDEAAQGQGHGAAAVALLKGQARDWGLPRLAASIVDAPDSPMGFYERLGFRSTGTIIDGEIVVSVSV